MIVCENEWKDIPGYEGKYQANPNGEIRSVDHFDSKGRFWKGRVLTQNFDGRGHYLHVALNNKAKNVHRLIAITFLPNPNNLPEVNHKDECKTNNSVSNLEWCDHRYNNIYGSKRDSKKGERHHGAKLTESQVRELRSKYKNGASQASLAKEFNISTTHANAICLGRYWGWLE